MSPTPVPSDPGKASQLAQVAQVESGVDTKVSTRPSTPWVGPAISRPGHPEGAIRHRWVLGMMSQREAHGPKDSDSANVEGPFTGTRPRTSSRTKHAWWPC